MFRIAAELLTRTPLPFYFMRMRTLILQRPMVLYCLLGLALIVFGYCLISYWGLDFYTYFKAALGFHHGTRPYLELMHVSPYYYPPLTAQLIAPLTFLPAKFVLGIWYFLSVMAIVIAVYLLTGGKQFPVYLIIAFGFLPVENTLYAGQVEAFLLLALSFSYYALSKNNYIGAGFGIALGIMLKIIPVALLVYFIWRRQIKAAAAVLIFLAILFAISLPFAGWQGWLDFFHVARYFGNPPSMHSVQFEEIINNGSNQALSGLVARLISNDELSIRVWRLSTAILALATLLVFCKRRAEFAKIFDLEFSLILITINLIMPYTWYHQYILLLIPILIICRRAEREASFRLLRLPLIIGYLLVDLDGLLWHHIHNPVLSSIPMFFALFLWIVLAKQISYYSADHAVFA